MIPMENETYSKICNELRHITADAGQKLAKLLSYVNWSLASTKYIVFFEINSAADKTGPIFLFWKSVFLFLC